MAYTYSKSEQRPNRLVQTEFGDHKEAGLLPHYQFEVFATECQFEQSKLIKHISYKTPSFEKIKHLEDRKFFLLTNANKADQADNMTFALIDKRIDSLNKFFINSAYINKIYLQTTSFESSLVCPISEPQVKDSAITSGCSGKFDHRAEIDRMREFQMESLRQSFSTKSKVIMHFPMPD